MTVRIMRENKQVSFPRVVGTGEAAAAAAAVAGRCGAFRCRPCKVKLTSSARARRVGTALQKQASSRVYRFYDRASLAVPVRPSFPLVF